MRSAHARHAAPASPVASATPATLGALAALSGTWAGHGLTVGSRPSGAHGDRPAVSVSPTREHARFAPVATPLRTTGLAPAEIPLYGLHYLHRSLAQDGCVLLLEPGLWVNLAPVGDGRVARMGSVPGGTVIVAEGRVTHFDGPPTIGPAGVTLPADGSRVQGATRVRSEMLRDPNAVLRAALRRVHVLDTVQIDLCSRVRPSAATARHERRHPSAVVYLAATIWIERVAEPRRATQSYVQLQYSQTTLVEFADRPDLVRSPAGPLDPAWPAVAVGSLVRET